MDFSHGDHADAQADKAPERSSPGGEFAPSLPIQRKLAIGRTDDPAEAEADHIADRVMRMAEPGPIGPAPSQLSRKCEACEKEDELATKLQTKRDGGGTLNGSEARPIVHEVLRSPGQPLDAGVRAFMEPRFGRDFSQVRVHTGTKAADSARAVSARAYTVGRDVVFDEGQYAPGTTAGAKLVAHELTHVVQQTTGLGSALALQRDFWDDEEEEEEGGVFDWVSEQVDEAVDWGGETGGEVVDWATEAGGEAVDWGTKTAEDVVDWASDADGEVWDWASDTGGEFVDWGAETSRESGIPYPKEGEVVCNEDELCWQTRCEYSEDGEQICYWEPYNPPPPQFSEGEPKEGDVTCGDSGCFIYLCHLSTAGNWICQWSQQTCPEEEALAGSPDWCRDTTFSPITHSGERCYRRIIHPSYLPVEQGGAAYECPPSDHICFRPDCSSHPSPDKRGLAISKTNGQCEWDVNCIAQHIGADVIPETLEKLWDKIVGWFD